MFRAFIQFYSFVLCFMLMMISVQAKTTLKLWVGGEPGSTVPVDTFLHITLPALRPVTSIVFLMTVTGAFKVFDLVWATTQGGPIRASELLSTYMYKKGTFTRDIAGLTSAAMIMAGPIIILFLIFQRNFVHGMTQGAEK